MGIPWGRCLRSCRALTQQPSRSQLPRRRHRSPFTYLQFVHDQHHQQPQEGEEAEDGDEDDDVLLVSDWDDNLDGLDALGDFDVLDGSRHTEPGRHRHAAEGRRGYQENDSAGSENTEDEDVDVLLVGDYNPVEEEEEQAGLAGMPSPMTGGSRRGSSRRGSSRRGSLLEVRCFHSHH